MELESEFRIAVIVKMLRPDNYGDCCQVVSKADEALKKCRKVQFGSSVQFSQAPCLKKVGVIAMEVATSCSKKIARRRCGDSSETVAPGDLFPDSKASLRAGA